MAEGNGRPVFSKARPLIERRESCRCTCAQTRRPWWIRSEWHDQVVACADTVAHRFDCECPSGGPCASETGTLLTRRICRPADPSSSEDRRAWAMPCRSSSAIIIVVELRCLVKSFDQCHPNAKLYVMSGCHSRARWIRRPTRSRAAALHRAHLMCAFRDKSDHRRDTSGNGIRHRGSKPELRAIHPV